ncbi:MAG: hypothetical protein RL549_499, partial [Verrucomicrobiota bacterium]
LLAAGTELQLADVSQLPSAPPPFHVDCAWAEAGRPRTANNNVRTANRGLVMEITFELLTL